jgi:hypothetical protein
LPEQAEFRGILRRPGEIHFSDRLVPVTTLIARHILWPAGGAPDGEITSLILAVLPGDFACPDNDRRKDSE